MSSERIVAAAVLLAGCACAPSVPAPSEPAVVQLQQDDAVQLELLVDEDRITAAESLTLRLRAVFPEEEHLEFLPLEGQLGDFLVARNEVSSPKLVAASSAQGDARLERLAVEQFLELEPLAPGEFKIPTLGVRHWPKPSGPESAVELTTDAVAVNVASILTDPAAGEELRDIAGPVEMPIPLWWKLAAVGAVLAAIALAVWLWRRRQARVADLTTPARPAHELALEDLDALLADQLVERGSYKVFYLRLSRILRRYVERRFSIHAPELTTEEFLVELQTRPEFAPAHRPLLGEFLQLSDLVKFAEHQPSPENSREAAAVCRRFVMETKPLDPVIAASGAGLSLAREDSVPESPTTHHS